jgi:transcriptional regulator with XRE-family HTH domain
MTTSLDIQFTISGLRKAGLTQAQIGDAVGLKQPTISDMESGKCGVKRPSHGLVTGLTALAAEYGVATAKAKRKPRQAAPP